MSTRADKHPKFEITSMRRDGDHWRAEVQILDEEGNPAGGPAEAVNDFGSWTTPALDDSGRRKDILPWVSVKLAERLQLEKAKLQGGDDGESAGDAQPIAPRRKITRRAA